MPSCQATTLKVETHYATNRGDKSRRHIAVTSRFVCTDAATRLLALILSLRYLSHEFKLVWICATDQSGKILSQRQWFLHVTLGDLLQQPVAGTCRSDLSHRASRPSKLVNTILSSLEFDVAIYKLSKIQFLEKFIYHRIILHKTVISHRFAYPSRWRRKQWLGRCVWCNNFNYQLEESGCINQSKSHWKILKPVLLYQCI